MSRERIVYLPGRCNVCGKEMPKVPFVGDVACAMMSERRCPNCGNAIYRMDDEDERDIADSCWDRGQNGDPPLG